MKTKKTSKAKVTPLVPAATEAEKNRASEIWTAAQDVMVARGYGRHLWGNQAECCHEFVILMLRFSGPGDATIFQQPTNETIHNDHTTE